MHTQEEQAINAKIEHEREFLRACPASYSDDGQMNYRSRLYWALFNHPSRRAPEYYGKYLDKQKEWVGGTWIHDFRFYITRHKGEWAAYTEFSEPVPPGYGATPKEAYRQSLSRARRQGPLR